MSFHEMITRASASSRQSASEICSMSSHSIGVWNCLHSASVISLLLCLWATRFRLISKSSGSAPPFPS